MTDSVPSPDSQQDPSSVDPSGLDPATFAWSDLAAVNRWGSGALHQRMGIVVTEVSPQRVVGTMPVEGNTQPYGLLHGGASAVLAEGLGSILGVILAGPGRAPVGVDLNATHHRPMLAGTVTGVATPLAAGRTTGCVGIAISDEQGRRVCTARLTVAFRDLPSS